MKLILEHLYPDYREGMSSDELSEVIQKDGSNITRLKTFRQAQASKQAWRKKRSQFMTGINRFHRNNKVGDLKGKISDRLKNFGKVSPFTGGTDSDKDVLEYFDVSFRTHFDLYEFLGDLSLLESYTFESAGTFALEEQFIESALFADQAFKDLSEIRNCLLNGNPISSKVLETLLVLLDEKCFEKESPLYETYKKLISPSVPVAEFKQSPKVVKPSPVKKPAKRKPVPKKKKQ